MAECTSAAADRRFAFDEIKIIVVANVIGQYRDRYTSVGIDFNTDYMPSPAAQALSMFQSILLSPVKSIRSVWRYQRCNQNPSIEEEQTTQWPKENIQKDKQRSTIYTDKTKDRVTRTPLNHDNILYISSYYIIANLWKVFHFIFAVIM